MNNIVDLNEFKKQKRNEEDFFASNEESKDYSLGFVSGINEGKRIERKKTNILIFSLFSINFILLGVINYLLLF